MAEEKNKEWEREENFDLYDEETAAEIAPPLDYEVRDSDTETGGRGVGYAALILAILSLFMVPVWFGIAGIILGIIARARGATSLGNWAIGISIVSLVISILFAPLF